MTFMFFSPLDIFSRFLNGLDFDHHKVKALTNLYIYITAEKRGKSLMKSNLSTFKHGLIFPIVFHIIFYLVIMLDQ